MEHFTFDVHGEGMGFQIRSGDKVRLLWTPAGTLRAGDLIVFMGGWDGVARLKRLAVHRLMFKTRGGDGWRLWAKADLSWRLDSPIPETSVLGKVVAVSRDGGVSWAEVDPSRNRVRNVVLGLTFRPYCLFSEFRRIASFLFKNASARERRPGVPP
ncbi:MAG: hypothetical protein ACHQ2Z_16800 [Elusimicrobiota bacterium]